MSLESRQAVRIQLALCLPPGQWRAVLPEDHQGSPLPAASSAALPKHSSGEREARLSQGCAYANRKGWAGGKQQGWAQAAFLPCAHHRPLDTEGSGGNVCFRSKLQAPGCAGAQEAASLQSQEDLGTFLGPQRQGGPPSSVVWTDTLPGSPPSSPSRPPLTVVPAIPLCLFCSASCWVSPCPGTTPSDWL